MFSRITNIKAIETWGFLSEVRSIGVTCGIHVRYRIDKGLVYLNLSNTATNKIVSKKGLIINSKVKNIILNNCFCSLCNTKVYNLQICICVNSLNDSENIPSYPFYVQANKRDLRLVEEFFTVLRKKSQQHENGTKIYSKIRQDIIRRSRYSINNDDIGKILVIQKGECYYCGASIDKFDVNNKFHLDHLIPLSLGGVHSPLNLVISCFEFNLKKCKKTEEDFLKVLSHTRGEEWLRKRQEIISKNKKDIEITF